MLTEVKNADLKMRLFIDIMDKCVWVVYEFGFCVCVQVCMLIYLLAYIFIC